MIFFLLKFFIIFVVIVEVDKENNDEGDNINNVMKFFKILDWI